MIKLVIVASSLILLTTLLFSTPVFATTTVVDILSLPGDGHLYTSGTDWNIINEQDTALIDAASPTIYVDSTKNGSTFLNSRGVLFLNSSRIDYARIATATLYFYVDTITVSQADTTLLFLAPTGGHPINPLVQSDYNRDWYTTVIGYVTTEALTPGQYHSVTLDVGQWPARSDVAGVVMMTSLDYGAATPTGTNTIVVASSESIHPPRITIQYIDDIGTVSNQELRSILTNLNLALDRAVAVQNAIQEQLSTLEISVAAWGSGAGSQIDTLKQAISDQGDTIADVLNQLGTLPSIKTDIREVLTRQESMVKDLSGNLTTVREQVQTLKDSGKSGGNAILIVVNIIGLVVIIALLITVKRQMI